MKNDIDALRTKEENIHIHIYPKDGVFVELTSIILHILIMLLCTLKMVHTGFGCLTSMTSVNKGNIIKRGKRIHHKYVSNGYSLDIPYTKVKKYKRDKIKYMISLFFIWSFFILGAAIFLISYSTEYITEWYIHVVINNLGFILMLTALFIVKNNISNNIYRSRKILYSKMPNIDLKCMYCYENEEYINVNYNHTLMFIVKSGAMLFVLLLIVPFYASLVAQCVFFPLVLLDNRKQEMMLLKTRIKKYSNMVSFMNPNKKYKIIKIK